MIRVEIVFPLCVCLMCLLFVVPRSLSELGERTVGSSKSKLQKLQVWLVSSRGMGTAGSSKQAAQIELETPTSIMTSKWLSKYLRTYFAIYSRNYVLAYLRTCLLTYLLTGWPSARSTGRSSWRQRIRRVSVSPVLTMCCYFLKNVWLRLAVVGYVLGMLSLCLAMLWASSVQVCAAARDECTRVRRR